MCLAMLVIPFLNAIAKGLQSDIPVLQIVWSRYAGHLLFMLVLFLPSRGLALFYSQRPFIQLLRSVLLMVSTVCYFTALKSLSLPTAVAISYTSPIITVALAAPILGERVGLRRWAIVIFGFLGVLVVLKPGSADVNWSGLLVVMSAACYALYQILTRKIAAFDSTETTITYTAVVGAVVLSVAMIILPDSTVLPSSELIWFLFVAIGIVAGVGHYLIVRAHAFAPVSILSPLNYIQLIGATLLSLVIFGELPGPTAWLGSGMIVIASIVLLFDDPETQT